ncbi:hypothetical protein [Micromonospora sp. IBHARD004]|uniref:hypothetical protein n=1 Tax=Micromonospora sp. IBHARD004 TaxID=3457764 RepID=UPI00405942F6
MRTRSVLAVLATALLGLIGGMVLAPAPAYAGNWAVTALDPVPDRMEPGKGYTVGMWVLQHGFHPYEGDLGKVALRLVDAEGTDQGSEGNSDRTRTHRAGFWQSASQE